MFIWTSFFVANIAQPSYQKESSCAELKSFRLHTVRPHITTDLFNNSIGGNLVPLIRNRIELFDLPSLDLNWDNTDETEVSISDLPSGLQRYEPTEFRLSHEEGGKLVEEVDQFRFVVDKEELRRAMASGTPMKVKQQSKSGVLDQDREFFIDPTILQSLENPNLDTSNRIQMDIHYDLFANSVSGFRDDQQDRGESSVTNGQRSRQPTSTPYNGARMIEAEQSVRSAMNRINTRELNNKAPHSNREVATRRSSNLNPSSNSRTSMAWSEVNRNVLKSLAITNRAEVGADIIGVLSITAAAYGTLRLFERIVTSFEKLARLCVGALSAATTLSRRIPVPPAFLRRNKKVVYIISSALLAWVLAVAWRKRLSYLRYEWVGHS